MGATIVSAPGHPAPRLDGQKSVFLAGPTNPTGEPDWRETLTAALIDLPVVIYNPKRTDWDSTWKEDFSDSRWAEQVEWELEMRRRADIVVVFFHRATLAPISLLEFGLSVHSGQAIVCAQDGYAKRGNVEAVCRQNGTKLVNSEEDLKNVVIERLKKLLAE